MTKYSNDDSFFVEFQENKTSQGNFLEAFIDLDQTAIQEQPPLDAADVIAYNEHDESEKDSIIYLYYTCLTIVGLFIFYRLLHRK